MKKTGNREFLFEVVSLVLISILVQAVYATYVRPKAEAIRAYDAELSMVRYVAWAIPAIGFVGTVRGIGESLQQAHKAVEGDVSGVVAGLGISFNSTLVALALSILVMFLLHQIQLRQERAVLDIEEFLDTHVVRQMLVR